MKSEKPLVSICVPTFNNEKYIRQCLDSILVQSYKNLEIIVSDNASTDGTAAILQEYADKHKIRLYLNKINIGAGANFNKLISIATGEYIAIYHSDDIYEKTIVEESVELISQDEEIGLVGTMGSAVDCNGAYLYPFELPDQTKCLKKNIYDFEEALMGVLNSRRKKLFFVTPSIMVRSLVYKNVGLFDMPKYQSSCDTELWLRVAKKYKVAILDRKLIKYRIHSEQGSELEMRKNIEVPDIFVVISEYRNYTDNDIVKKKCDSFLDGLIIKAAIKQNLVGKVEKSNDTLAKIKTLKYKLIGIVIWVANKAGLKMKGVIQ